VNLFGFSYSMDMLNKRDDARSPRMSRFHDWAGGVFRTSPRLTSNQRTEYARLYEHLP